MRMLAIETATEACSVALFDDGALVDARHETIGRGHAERLVPLIASLDGSGRADAIRVSLGPGSFTGTRIGLAAARALGVAWGARVEGYPTLALVAAMAQQERPGPVTVCMTGGHGEWFVQEFGADGLPSGGVRSLAPACAARAVSDGHVAGSQAAALAALEGGASLSPVTLPDAKFTDLIPGTLLTDNLAILYGRPPDARLPG